MIEYFVVGVGAFILGMELGVRIGCRPGQEHIGISLPSMIDLRKQRVTDPVDAPPTEAEKQAIEALNARASRLT